LPNGKIANILGRALLTSWVSSAWPTKQTKKRTVVVSRKSLVRIGISVYVLLTEKSKNETHG
jgi:hypothetical protein